MSFCLSAFSMAARLPQAGTCCGCQPEGLKFLQLAQPLLKLRKQKGEGAAVNCGWGGWARAPAKAGCPTAPLYSASPAQLPCHTTGWKQREINGYHRGCGSSCIGVAGRPAQAEPSKCKQCIWELWSQAVLPGLQQVLNIWSQETGDLETGSLGSCSLTICVTLRESLLFLASAS